MTCEDLLSYWFGDWDDEAPLAEDDPQVRRWWDKDPEIDAEIAQRFGALHAEVIAGGQPTWADTPRGLLAHILVLDQLSRAIYRGSSRAFDQDPQARQLTAVALERAWDRDLKPIERVFLYLPLVHAEDRVAHRRALSLFTGLAEELEELGAARADYYRRIVHYELRHKQIIDRFGRYPHRNFSLERTATPEELAFLDHDGSF